VAWTALPFPLFWEKGGGVLFRGLLLLDGQRQQPVFSEKTVGPASEDCGRF
jgi:hypothetical protein